LTASPMAPLFPRAAPAHLLLTKGRQYVTNMPKPGEAGSRCWSSTRTSCFSAFSAFSAVRGIMRAFQYAFSSRKYWKTPGKSPLFGFKGKEAIASLARSYDTKMTTFSAQKTQKTIKMHSQRPSEPFFRAAWLPPIRAFFTTGEFQLISLPSSPLCAISVPKKGPKRPEFSPPSFFFTHTTHPAPRSPRPLRSLRLCERRSWPPSLRPPWFLHHPCPSAFICGSSSFALFASLREAILPTLSAPSALFASLREAILAALSAPSPLFASLREAILAALSAPSPRPLRFFLHPCPSAFICGSSSFALFASLREAILPTLSAPSALFASLREAILAALSAPSPLFASLREAILAALSAPSPRPLRFFLHPCPSAFICGSSSFALFASLREAILPTLSAPSALFASLREAILAALSAPSPLSAVPLPSFPNQVGIFSCSNHPKIPTFRGAPPFFRDYDLLFPLRSPRSRRLASSRAEWDPPARTRAFCKATEPDPILLSSSGSRGNPTFPKGPDFAPCCHFFCDRRRRLETTTPAQSIPVACLHTPTAFLTLTAARCRDSFVYSAKEKEFGRSSPTIALVKPMQPHMEALWFISNSQSTVRNGVGAGISSKGPINSQKEEGER